MAEPGYGAPVESNEQLIMNNGAECVITSCKAKGRDQTIVGVFLLCSPCPTKKVHRGFKGMARSTTHAVEATSHNCAMSHKKAEMPSLMSYSLYLLDWALRADIPARPFVI